MKNGFMVIIGVNDLDESIAFYQKHLGCTLLKRTSPAENVDIGFVTYNDAIEIELIRRKDLPPAKNEGAAVTLAFKTDDLARDYRTLKGEGVRCLGEPVTLPSGVKMLRFSDPNGVVLSLMEE